MPIYLGTAAVNQKQIALQNAQMQKVYVGNDLVWSKIVLTNIKYGALYNWYVASTANFAPAGWHVPTSAEWDILVAYLGGYLVAGKKVKEIGTTYWTTPNTGATNEIGFNWRGGGRRDQTGAFNNKYNYGFIWANTLFAGTLTTSYLCYYNSDQLSNYGGGWIRTHGASLRLIKDNSTNPGTITDYDGNVYNCVTIGTQVWIASNWCCTKQNDGTPIPIVTDNSAWAALTSGAMCAYNNDWSNVKST